MAGRSFKPASYLASTTTTTQSSPKLKPARPPFARTASSSSAHSTHSTHSDDSFILSLKALTTVNPPDDHGGLLRDGASPHSHSTGNTGRTSLDDTPPRKRSQPIPIEVAAARERPAYTPLSARGDLPGGYFPNHAPLIKPYRANQPFSQSYLHQHHPAPKSRSTHQSSLSYSSQSSPSSPPPPDDETPMSGTTPRINPPQTATSVMHEMNMKHLMQPKGKYHPSNYQLSPATPTSQGPTIGVTNVPAQINMNNLHIPSKHNKEKRELPSGHERIPSDVKRQLRQYQRDLIVTARITQAAGGGPSPKPKSPQLLPLGSPGPITPFELEQESRGYILARGSMDTSREIAAAEDNDRREQNRKPGGS